MKRPEFTERVKVLRLNHAGWKCEGLVERDKFLLRCNAELTRKRVAFDHHVPCAEGGKATFDNCRAICSQCHKDKYPDDIKRIASERRKLKKREEKIQSQSDWAAPAVGLSEIARRFGK